MIAVTRQLAEILARTRYSELPEQVKVDARRSVLDWVGSALAGSRETPAQMVRGVVNGFGCSDQAHTAGTISLSAMGEIRGPHRWPASVAGAPR